MTNSKLRGRNQLHGLGIGQAVNNLRVYVDSDFNKSIVRLPKKLNEVSTQRGTAA